MKDIFHCQYHEIQIKLHTDTSCKNYTQTHHVEINKERYTHCIHFFFHIKHSCDKKGSSNAYHPNYTDHHKAV